MRHTYERVTRCRMPVVRRPKKQTVVVTASLLVSGRLGFPRKMDTGMKARVRVQLVMDTIFSMRTGRASGPSYTTTASSSGDGVASEDGEELEAGGEEEEGDVVEVEEARTAAGRQRKLDGAAISAVRRRAAREERARWPGGGRDASDASTWLGRGGAYEREAVAIRVWEGRERKR